MFIKYCCKEHGSMDFSFLVSFWDMYLKEKQEYLAENFWRPLLPHYFNFWRPHFSSTSFEPRGASATWDIVTHISFDFNAQPVNDHFCKTLSTVHNLSSTIFHSMVSWVVCPTSVLHIHYLHKWYKPYIFYESTRSHKCAVDLVINIL